MTEPLPSTEVTPPSALARRSRRLIPDGIWVALLVVLALWVIARLGLFDLRGDVQIDGATVSVPSTLASVDHPFHATRANTLLQSLADGHLLRWVDDHQGGYPAEFYPLGVAWLDVGVWLMLFGQVPMIVVHKIVAGMIFLLPGVAFALMARRDGWPLSVAGVAFAAQVAIAGGWWHGGYTELVQWGLVTNVAANVALLVTLFWLTRYLDQGRATDVAGAVLAAGFAIVTNPRSLVGLGVIGVGVWLAHLSLPEARRRGIGQSIARLGIVGGLTGLIAAPELISLLRFSRFYQFVRYEWYDTPREYLDNAAEAVSWPLLLMALIAVVAIWWLPPRPITRAAAVCLLLYSAVTLLISESAASGLLSQLEATRLMPFQRLVTLFLGAVGLHLLLTWLTAAVKRRQAMLVNAASLVVAIGVLVMNIATAGEPPPEPIGELPPTESLFAVETTVAVSQTDFQTAIEAADAAAESGTALLVLGSALSWHQQLWAPVWTERPLFYNDWLWYWHPWHAGPPGYQFEAGHAYPLPELALERAYLDRHGIGAVAIVDEQAKRRAASSPDLTRVRSGLFDVYAVREPATLITLSGANVAMSGGDQSRLTASGRGSGGTAEIRRNWYPRWRATVNGEPVPITRTADGYMSVPVPAGAVDLNVAYQVDGLDWLARGLTMAGVVGVAVLLLTQRVRWARHRARRTTMRNPRPTAHLSSDQSGT